MFITLLLLQGLRENGIDLETILILRTLAYASASKVDFNRLTISNFTIDGNVTLASDYEIRESNLTETTFVAPLLSHPIAIVYNLASVSVPLNLTEDLIVRMITGNITKWNDVDLVAYNPALSTINFNARFVYRGGSSPITQVILNHFFPEQASNQNGTWSGIVVGGVNVATGQGYSQVVSVMASSANSWGFAPLPAIMSASATTLKPINLVRSVVIILFISNNHIG